jgi:hypothetical protein
LKEEKIEFTEEELDMYEDEFIENLTPEEKKDIVERIKKNALEEQMKKLLVGNRNYRRQMMFGNSTKGNNVVSKSNKKKNDKRKQKRLSRKMNRN